VNIVVDASALLAVLLGEPDAEEYLSKLVAARTVRISPVNWWEVQVRIRSRYGAAGEAGASAWLAKMQIEVEPATLEHAQIALAAYARYRGRQAKLNLGDCFAYALAQASNAPLLYKGANFVKTDISRA
jgi:ribonuclease VapC